MQLRARACSRGPLGGAQSKGVFSGPSGEPQVLARPAAPAGLAQQLRLHVAPGPLCFGWSGTSLLLLYFRSPVSHARSET